MLRVALAGVAAVALALLPMPKGCTKTKPAAPDPEPSPTPVSIPVTSATTPPIWHPPDSAGTPATIASAAPPPSADLVKARAAADAKDFKKVKSLLEKKVRAGKCAPEESQLVFRACVQLKDKACADGVKAKHPEDITD